MHIALNCQESFATRKEVWEVGEKYRSLRLANFCNSPRKFVASLTLCTLLNAIGWVRPGMSEPLERNGFPVCFFGVGVQG